MLSPYPHYSWLAHWIEIQPPRVYTLVEARHVTHRVLLTTAGDARVVWNAHGSDVQFQSTLGDLGFYPCDYASHRLGITAMSAYRTYVVLLPDAHLREIQITDELPHGSGCHAVPVFQDAVLAACLIRLAEGNRCRHVSEDIGDEISARQIVARLCILGEAPPPDWQMDMGVFSPRVMRQVVERVDSHLAIPASLEQVSTGFGLSPSHFARKFHRSTGLSLNRFMNRRRIGLALALLKSTQTPLAQLSLDLGFCSQSHFTRVFRAHTGITPHQFNRGRRRTKE